jgi:hypothetical protein
MPVQIDAETKTYRITLDRNDYESLLVTLGYAIGAAIKDEDARRAWAILRLANRINEGNPAYIPYKVPPEAEAHT